MTDQEHISSYDEPSHDPASEQPEEVPPAQLNSVITAEIAAILDRIDEARAAKEQAKRFEPVYVCAHIMGSHGYVCGMVFHDGRPEICPRCGTVHRGVA